MQIVEIEMPKPGPGEILVEVMAAGINHVESLLRRGEYPDEFEVEFPVGQGSDFAGLVTSVGEGVTRFKKNDEVLGHTAMASHATHIVVPARNAVAKPAALGWEVAGSLFLAGFAATETIQAVNVGKGDTVVISAAAGGVGSMQAHLAMNRGARVIGTCGERNFDYLRQIGVTPVVYGAGLTERIRAVAPGGVSAYLDNFGQDNADVATELGVSPARFRSSDHRRKLELEAMHPSDERRVEYTRTLEHLAALAADRSVNVLISGFYPFDRIGEAFDDLEKRHARGKVVVGMRPVDDSFHGMRSFKKRDEQERRA